MVNNNRIKCRITQKMQTKEENVSPFEKMKKNKIKKKNGILTHIA